MQAFITPGFQTETKIIEDNIYNIMEDITNETERVAIVIYVIEGAIALVCFGLVLYRITKIVSSFASIMEVFTQFNQPDIEKIYKYCYFLAKFFKHLKKKDREQRSIAREEDPDLMETSKLGGQSNLSFNANYY